MPRRLTAKQVGGELPMAASPRRVFARRKDSAARSLKRDEFFLGECDSATKALIELVTFAVGPHTDKLTS